MESIFIEDILSATNGQLINGNRDTVVYNISTDSRKVKSGDLFIPLIGEKYDGHIYIEEAIKRGAVAVLTQKEIIIETEVVIIKVENTLRAFADIARNYRLKFTIPIIGIVGSVGKTSTKDMIYCCLSTKMDVLKTEGNFNNEVGVPITLLNINRGNDAAIIEMGMNNKGEISRLTNMVKPKYVVISNIGISHIENLGSKENILKAKLEVLEGLDKNGIVFLNGDDILLNSVKDKLGFKVITFGIESDCTYRAKNVKNYGEEGVVFDITIEGKEYEISIPAVGEHNVYNALAGIAVGHTIGIPIEKLTKGILNFKSGKMRLNILECNGFKIINDSYNASPDSMKAAIRVLAELSIKNRSIAVLGDMLELGEWSVEAHTKVGVFAKQNNIDYIITVGRYSRNIAKGALDVGANPENIYSFDNNDEVGEFLRGFIKKGDNILLKGSRGMKLEKIIDVINK